MKIYEVILKNGNIRYEEADAVLVVNGFVTFKICGTAISKIKLKNVKQINFN